MFTIPSFIQSRQAGKPIVMLTCYDAASASALDGSGVDCVLVGDSVAMVVHGQDSTLNANVGMIEAHVRAVRAGAPGLCVIADMPFLSTRTGVSDAVRAAGALMQAGANAVKIEGLAGHEELIPHLIASGIPVMGHLGLQPQSVNVYGAYRVQGGSADQAELIMSQARALEDLGCFAIVLECVPSALAARVTGALGIPTIGIGAGPAVSGQVLVLQDLVGYPVHAEAKVARFVRRYANARSSVREAARAWAEDVRSGNFPAARESFGGDALAGAYGGQESPEQALKEASGAGAGAAKRGGSAIRVFSEPAEWKAYCRALARRGSIGFVPTMGALHAGHASLVRRSAAENDFTLVSIFVNPTQFNDPKDLAAYPRTIEADCALLEAAGATAVFLPTPETMYPDKYAYKITENDLSTKYCGAFRPGHFDGVLAVVMKLLQLVAADRAYFGEKDWQQYLLIRGMAEAYFLDTAIVPCPIVREANGLAMSSRNTRLSGGGLAAASALYRAIAGSESAESAKASLERDGFKVEYIEDRAEPHDGTVRRLAAAWIEGVRLIDNVAIGADGRELRGGDGKAEGQLGTQDHGRGAAGAKGARP